jgi:hypothetical protein
VVLGEKDDDDIEDLLKQMDPSDEEQDHIKPSA